MTEVLIDTSVLVDYTRGRELAVDDIEQVQQLVPPLTHPAVVAEILEGARDTRDLRALDQAVSKFALVDVQAIDLTLALELLRQFRLSHQIGWVDCLIAATALRIDVMVATLNVKHFAIIPGLRVVRPY